MMLNLTNDSFACIYKELLYNLVHNPQYISEPRGMSINELLGVCFILTNPKSSLFVNNIRSTPLRYLCGELLWYFDGRNDLKFISDYSSFWKQIANMNGTLNSAYGYEIFRKKNEHKLSQWEWARNCLLNDIYSRQAVILFNSDTNQYFTNKDFPCTLYIQFLIRNNELNLFCYMRSQDIFLGATYDIVFFTLLMQCMLIELKPYYKNLKIGYYQHSVGSLHLYHTNLLKAEEMLKNSFTGVEVPSLKINPILNKEIVQIINRRYNGDDVFFEWLNSNTK